MSANAQLKDLRRIQRLGVTLARQRTKTIRQRALKAFKDGGVSKTLTDVLDTAYKDALRKALVAAHLTAYKRTFSYIPGMRFASGLDPLKETLRQQLDISSLQELESLYDSEAVRLLQGVSANVETELRKTVNTLISEGATTVEGTRRLSEKFDALGLSPNNSYQVENLFRTQVQLTYNSAKWQAEQEPYVQEILWGYHYVTVGDDRVRDEHARLDGTKLPKEDPFWEMWYPPNGWSCRCQVIPIFDKGKPKKPRISPEDQPDPDFRFNPGKAFVSTRIAPPVENTSFKTATINQQRDKDLTRRLLTLQRRKKTLKRLSPAEETELKDVRSERRNLRETPKTREALRERIDDIKRAAELEGVKSPQFKKELQRLKAKLKEAS